MAKSPEFIANIGKVNQFATKESKSRGGIKGGETRDFLKLTNKLLDMNMKTQEGVTLTRREAIILKQIHQALTGDTRAFVAVRDTSGSKPVDKVEISSLLTPEQTKASQELACKILNSKL